MVRKSSSAKKVIKPKSRAGIKSKPSQEAKATDSSQKIESKLKRFEKQLAQREAELQIVNSIQEKLASGLDIQTIIDLVGDQMRAIAKASSLFVGLSDTTSKIVSWPYCVNNNQRIESPSAPLSKNITRSLFYAAKPLNLGTEQEILAYGAIPQEGSRVGKSFLGIPFTVGNAMLGVVSIHDIDHEHAFTAAEERLLQTLANAMGVALEKARLFAETRRLFKARQQRSIELQVINSVQEGLASRLEMKAIYQLVGEKISEIFTADTTFIATFKHGNRYVDPQYYVEKGQAHFLNEPLLFGEGLYSQVIQSRKHLLVGTTAEQQQLGTVSIPSPDSDEDLNQSFLGVPILLSENITGVVSVQSYLKNAYTENDVRLLTTIANSMSVALENARLFDETQRLLKETEQQNAELQIINSVQVGLASKLDMPAIYELVGEKIRETFDAQIVTVDTFEPATQLLHSRYYFEADKAQRGTPYPLFGFRRHVIENRQPLTINQDMARWLEEYDNPVYLGARPKSAIFIPMLAGDTAIGVISLQNNDHENAFTDADVRLLTTLANSMSVALENARLFDETQRLLKETEQRAEELATVNAVGTALAGELDLNALIQLVGEQVRSVFRADIAFVALLDKENSVINFPYQYGEKHEPIQWGQGLTSRIIQGGQPLLINQDMDRQRRQLGVTLIGKGAQSFLGVPIFVAGESIGVVSVQSTKQEGLFSENDQHLLSTIAANVGIAFQNARLFDETQRLFQAERRAHEQTETLRSVAQALNRSLSLTEVFNLVLTEIQKVIPYDSAGVYQVHENRRVFVTGRGFSNLKDLVGISFEFDQHEDEIGYLISQSLQPLILEDATHRYPQYFSTGTHAATKIRSYMAVPIMLNQKLIGMITLGREEPGFYSDQHAGLATAFAAQAATAINNARLFDETQQRNAELAVINSIQAGLSSKLDMQAIYDLIGDKIRDIFQAETVAINYYDEKQDLISTPYLWSQEKRLPYEEPVPLSAAPLRKFLIDSRKPWIINQDSTNIPESLNAEPDEHLGRWPKSGMGTLIIASDKVIGIIQIANMEQENVFTDSDLRLLETIANSMSIALENARLWEQEKMYRKALERELEIGREIQAGFLPETLPQVEGWEIAASLMSAREVAGDFYDVFELPDGNIGLVIADVCDKGVGAALFMTLFRSLIRVTSNREYFEYNGTSGPFLSMPERLKHAMMLTNNYISKTHQASSMFATVFFGILDPRERRLIYINGGHEAPLIVQAGKVRASLCKTGPAVGAIHDAHFEVHSLQLHPDELFFAFTDGAPDAKDPRGAFFGRDRLLDILRGHRGSAQELIKIIEAELHHYMDSATQFDDITLLAVQQGPGS